MSDGAEEPPGADPPGRRRLISIEVPSERPRSRPAPDLLSPVRQPFVGGPAFLGRVALLAGAALVAFGVLAVRLWAVAVIDRQHYVRSAARETTRVVRLPAGRGTIIDREGVVLADTTGSTVVTADVRALGSGSDSGWRPDAYGRRLLARLGSLTSTGEAVFVARIRADLVQDPYAPAVVLGGVSEPLASYLSERASEFRGLNVASEPTRRYPQGALGGSFLGLLGQLTASEIARRSYPWARPGELVGQSGIEAAYDQVLNGGFELGTVHVDALGVQVGAIEPTPPDSSGPETLQLTIDTRLQRAAEQALRDGISQAHAAGYRDADGGAAIVMNPQTGAIEALASSPELDQSAAAGDPAYLESLLNSDGALSPLYNQATQGLFPLGSTFKPVVAEAALSAGLITGTSTLPCVGSLTVGGIVFHNVESWIDASLDLPQALEISCDTWFYRLGEDFFALQQQGQLDIQHWAELFGFGSPTGIDIPGESAGIVPTPEWLEHSDHEAWYEGDSVNLSIGQGFLEATPLQLAVAYSALANGGTVVRPHLAEAVLHGGQRTVLRFPPVRHLKLLDLGAIDQGLYLAAHAPEGTSAPVFADYPVPVAGKTGTAQTAGGSDDSWYASWAPASHPKVVVVVLIEHGGYGADAAAPAAREIYDAIFHLDA